MKKEIEVSFSEALIYPAETDVLVVKGRAHLQGILEQYTEQEISHALEAAKRRKEREERRKMEIYNHYKSVRERRSGGE